jgi:asparagine synthase (glutamine-hydrolysing)
MEKIWGIIGNCETLRNDSHELLTAMSDASHVNSVDMISLLNETSALAANHRQNIAGNHDLCVVCCGQPRLEHTPATASALLNLWQQLGPATLKKINGSFALAVIDHRENTVLLAIDRIGIHSLAFSITNKGLVFASRADAVAAHPDVGSRLSYQALYNYFYHYDIPAPDTIYQGVEKLLPGQYVIFKNGKLERNFYWHLKYRDQPRTDFEPMSEQFHKILRASVTRSADSKDTAAFLSGGTDSSTVAGILTELRGKSARTYSIGFSAEGFDEMEYARLAGQRFGLDMREYYLKPEDILSTIPVIAQHYDEPFANESAVPTYFCARMAKNDGYRVILAGDGGDEIFGGNSRYAKQKVFEAYYTLPASVRRSLIEPLANLPGLDRFAPSRKLQSYLRQANIPLPERMESYNYLYRQPLAHMFMPDFLAEVDPHLPARRLKECYDRTDSSSYINRMLHLDMKFTLADNDLRKVNGMCEAAGINVRYPLLDDEMVAFSAEVPPDWKVKGQDLRWFYRQALRGYLPDKIIDKNKHGFGLPFGLWARDYAPLREKIEDSLSDFTKRGWLQAAYIEQIRQDHMTGHATYFGKMLWVIVMLEEWLAQRNL